MTAEGVGETLSSAPDGGSKVAVRRLLLVGTALYGVAVVATRASSFIVILILSRLVTPRELGAISYVMAVFLIASVFADVGVGVSIPRFVPREARAGEIVAHALVLRLAAAATLAAGIWLADAAWGLFRGLGTAIAFLVVCSVVSSATSILDASLRFVAASAVRIGVGLGWIVGSIVLVKLGHPVWGPVLAYGVATLLVGLPTCLDSLRRYRVGFQRAVFAKLAGFGFRAVGVLALAAISSQAGLLILAYSLGDEAVAAYRVASMLASPPLLLAAAVGDPLTQLVSRADAQGDPAAPRRLIQSVLALLVVTAGVAAPLGLLFAADAVRVLLSGRYGESVGLLQVLFAANALGMLTTVATAALYALGEMSVLLPASVVSTAVTVAATALLLPPLGASGAAVAALVANLILVVWYGIWFRRYMRGSLDGAVLGRVLVFAAVAPLIAVLFAQAGLWERSAVGLVILAAYAALALSLVRPGWPDSGRWERLAGAGRGPGG